MHLTSRLICGLTLCAIGISVAGRGAQAAPRADGPPPDVIALLKRSTAAYKPLKSYQHTEVWKMTQGDRAQEVTYTLALERPNKFAYRSSNPNQDAAVSDGKKFINYKLQTHEYTQRPAPATYAGINIVDDVMFQPQVTYLVALMLQGDALADKDFTAGLIAHLKVGPATTLDGRKADTLVMNANGSSLTFYLDASTHRLTKSVQTITGQPITVTETVTDVKVDQSIDPAVFRYTPPEKANMVAKFTDPQAAQAAQMKALVEKYEGKPALDINLKTRDGKDISLTALRGKVVVVDFWASWCGPCKRVMPIIQEIHEKYGDKGVMVLAVDTWDAKDDCDKFLKENTQYTMPILMDPAEKNTEESVATKLYGVHGIPTTLIIDKEGVVRTYAIGAHERSFYMDAIKKLGIEIAAK